jgi:hypothetical protein
VARRRAGLSGRDDDLAARAVAWVERHCAEQGVPLEIDDRQTLAQIAELLGLAGQSRKTGRKRDSSSGAL